MESDVKQSEQAQHLAKVISKKLHISTAVEYMFVCMTSSLTVCVLNRKRKALVWEAL